MTRARQALISLLEQHGADLPLDEAAAWMAAEEDDRVSAPALLAQLDALSGSPLPDAPLVESIARINHRLFAELGFSGDEQTYDDPRNSRLDQVIHRRRGLPILLSLVYIEVARRMGVEILGVGFPSHFLVRPASSDAFFVDPFHQGRILRPAQLQVWLSELFQGAVIEPQLWKRAVRPVSNRRLMLRINANLKASFLRREDLRGAIRASERLLLLEPRLPDERRDLGQMLLSVGRREEGVAELAHYLAERPNSPDAWWIARELSGKA